MHRSVCFRKMLTAPWIRALKVMLPCIPSVSRAFLTGGGPNICRYTAASCKSFVRTSMSTGGEYRGFASGKSAYIPEEKLDISFTRSSGAGGQNVNKVSSKVEIRFVVDEAYWMDVDTRQRLKETEAGRMNKAGELILTCQEHRTQLQNKAEAMKKLREMVEDAMIPPKEREIREGISVQGKMQRKADKRHRGAVKRNRGQVRFDD